MYPFLWEPGGILPLPTYGVFLYPLSPFFMNSHDLTFPPSDHIPRLGIPENAPTQMPNMMMHCDLTRHTATTSDEAIIRNDNTNNI